MKLTKRKGFNFFRSYYDVFNELTEKDKLPFIQALLDKQFQGINPKGLKGMAKFAWISQVNSIDSQVKGWEDKLGLKLTPTEGGSDTPALQVEGKVEVEGKEKEKEKEKVKRFAPPSILEVANYVKEKNYNIDAGSFISYYEARGWVMGKTKMKSWKAALSTWNKRDNNSSNTAHNQNAFV